LQDFNAPREEQMGHSNTHIIVLFILGLPVFLSKHGDTWLGYPDVSWNTFLSVGDDNVILLAVSHGWLPNEQALFLGRPP